MFCEILKNLRLQSGLNKRQAAILLNLPYTTYNNYETGSREPNSEVLVKIANTFHVSTDYLLNNPPFKGNLMPLTEEEKDIIIKYRDLPEGIQNAVKQMINTTYSYRPEAADSKENTHIDMESPAALYHSDIPCSAQPRKIVVAAYGDGVHMRTCPVEKQAEIQEAQKELQISLEIAKRREMYGK